MINVNIRDRQCAMPECAKYPSCNFPGSTDGLYCGAWPLPGHATCASAELCYGSVAGMSRSLGPCLVACVQVCGPCRATGSYRHAAARCFCYIEDKTPPRSCTSAVPGLWLTYSCLVGAGKHKHPGAPLQTPARHDVLLASR